MRSTVLAALLVSAALAPTAVRAETGDDAASAVKQHPAPFPHVHPRRVVRVVRPAPPPPRNHRMSAYFKLGGLGNFFVEGEEELSRVYQGGGGLDLALGLRIAPVFAVEFGWLAAFQATERYYDEVGTATQEGVLQSVYFDGKIFFIPSSDRIEPFIQLGLGAYIMSESFAADLTGFGFHIGGGVDLRLSDFVAVGLKAMYHGFYVDNAEQSYYGIPTESAFLNTIMLEANLQFHF